MTDYTSDFLVGQVLGDRHSLFRFAGVIALDQQGIVAGDYIVDVLKGKKVVVLHDKDTLSLIHI